MALGWPWALLVANIRSLKKTGVFQWPWVGRGRCWSHLYKCPLCNDLGGMFAEQSTFVKLFKCPRILESNIFST